MRNLRGLSKQTLGSVLGVGFAALVAMVGCAEEGAELPLPLPSETEAPSEIVFSAGEMSAGLTWAESKVLPAPDGATRIGMMVDLNDPSQLAAFDGRIEVRGFAEDGAPTGWMTAEVTWSEEVYLVARADPGQLIHAAQLRVPSELLANVANVTMSAVIPDEETSSESPSFGTTESALTVSDVVRPRSAWKARPTKCSSQNTSKYRMAIHHTYTPPSSSGSYEARLRGIQAYHMDTRGWCDVGYHFLVTQDGTVWEGRPIKFIGAHVGGHNTGNVGISFVGCFQTGACDSMGTMVPSHASLQGAANVVAAISDQYGIKKTTTNIKGHGQHSGASTSCPGDNLLARIPDILTMADGGTVDSGGGETPPAPQNGRVMGVVWDLATGSSPSDSGAKRITGATVSVSGGPTLTAEGPTAYWETELEAGTWTVSASAPGYQTTTRTVSVTAGGGHWASIGLIELAAVPNDGPTQVRVVSSSGEALAASAVYADGQGTQLTDSSGRLILNLSGKTTLRAWAAGHMSEVVVADQGQTVDIKLAPEQKVAGSGLVQGVVWDASKTTGPSDTGAERLDGTLVICSCGLAREARDGDAYWSFNAPAGNQSFTGLLPGYETITRTVSVTSNGNEWGSIGLVPAGASTTPPVETPPVETPPATEAEVCYPGASMAWNVCFPLVPRAELAEGGYTHPAGAPASAQYTQPTHFLDLTSVDPTTKLAPNFTLGEFMQSAKGRYGVYSPKAVQHFQAVRSALGVPLSVNSGYRSPSYNAGIAGSATWSRHTYGDAADVTANGKASLTAISNACYSNGADYVQLYTSHVHCDWRDDPLDPGFWAGANKPGAHKPGHDHGSAGTDRAWVEPPARAPRAGDGVLLEARYTGFDEGTPWVTWHVSGPGVDLTVEPAVHLAFEAPERGVYHVSWEVGGVLAGEMAIAAE